MTLPLLPLCFYFSSAAIAVGRREPSCGSCRPFYLPAVAPAESKSVGCFQRPRARTRVPRRGSRALASRLLRPTAIECVSNRGLQLLDRAGF